MNSSDSLIGPINLGNPKEFTIKELAKTVIEMIGSKSKLKFLPLPQDDPKQRQPDIRQANDYLNWAPTVSLREGLRHTIAYFDLLLLESGRTFDNSRRDHDSDVLEKAPTHPNGKGRDSLRL
jgi:UDP-glucuronate decarboxylase